MKFVSWNVNGIKEALDRGFMDYFNYVNADIFCIQGTKCQDGEVELDLPGYYQYWNSADENGNYGTAIFTREKPEKVIYGIADKSNDGRVITLEFDLIHVMSCHKPALEPDLNQLEYKMKWDDDFRKYVRKLDSKKPLIICGDLNVAHLDIDVNNPDEKRNNPGFTDQEREKMTELLKAGFTDTFRYFNPDRENVYSWWSDDDARAENDGSRFDYVLTAGILDKWLLGAEVHTDVMGSDHCPVFMDIM